MNVKITNGGLSIMATINGFKLIGQYSKKYYKYLELEKEIEEIEQKRLGLYLLTLECITSNAGINPLKKSIVVNYA